MENNNKRIAKNTIYLYIRMLLTMGVSLYTSRVVLNVLGVQDYGIYNVVGGVVAMFAMINGSLTAATQRFLTFELGKKDNQNTTNIFSAAITIHTILALIILILAESIGLWFLNSKINIPADRMNAANWVYQCSAFAFIINLIFIPFNAAIVAQERMKVYAYIGILEAILKLFIAFLIQLVLFDKLKLYANLILVVVLIIQTIYFWYCRAQFDFCRFMFFRDKKLYKEIAGFAGWNFIGASSSVIMTQGINIVLNLFFGVIVNAAQGIAGQVNTAIGSFVNNFMMALNPQITKSYAAGDKEYLMKLIYQGARFSFYLMLFLSLPVLIETETVLKIWLKMVPEYSVIFVRLTLILVISQTLSNTLITAQLATGNIKKYQIVVGGLQMLNLPASYIALHLGYAPYSVLVISIFISFVCLVARLWLLRGMIGLSAKLYLKNVILNVFFVTILSAFIPKLLSIYMEAGLERFLIISITCIFSTIAVLYFIGMSNKERIFVKSQITAFIAKRKK